MNAKPSCISAFPDPGQVPQSISNMSTTMYLTCNSFCNNTLGAAAAAGQGKKKGRTSLELQQQLIKMTKKYKAACRLLNDKNMA